MHAHFRSASLACALFMVLAGCGSSSSATPQAADTIFGHAKTAVPRAGHYLATYVTDDSGKITSLHQDVAFIIAARESHIILTTTQKGNPLVSESITTPTATYAKTNGTWLKKPFIPINVASLDIGHVALSQGTNPTLIGTETINGTSTYHLLLQFMDAKSGATASGDFWVRTDTYYVMKEASKVISTGASGNPATTTVDVFYDAYDEQIQITLPTVAAT